MTATHPLAVAFEAGTTLGDRYTLEREIARGGASTIWRARDVRLGRRVAVKIIDDAARARQEATMLVRCAGRGVVACYEIVHEGGATHTPALPHKGGGGQSAASLVLEDLDGPNLAQRLRGDAPMAAREALRVGLEAARALARVHAAGVVHGDVKPQHFVLTRDGVTLVDFGDARFVADSTDGGAAATGVRATAAYAAPELRAGGAPAMQSDAYALGIVLARLGERAGNTSDEWQALVARLTQEAPEGRGDAAAVARDLEEIAARV